MVAISKIASTPVIPISKKHAKRRQKLQPIVRPIVVRGQSQASQNPQSIFPWRTIWPWRKKTSPEPAVSPPPIEHPLDEPLKPLSMPSGCFPENDQTEMSVIGFMDGHGRQGHEQLKKGQTLTEYLSKRSPFSFIVGRDNKLHVDALKTRLPAELVSKITSMVEQNQIQLIQLLINDTSDFLSRNHVWCRQNAKKPGSWLVCPIARNNTTYGQNRIILPKAVETELPGNTTIFMPEEPLKILLPEWRENN